MSNNDLKGFRGVRARTKMMSAVVAAVIVGVVVAMAGKWQVALLAAWDAGTLVYLLWTWLTVWPMSGAATKRYAEREDPSRGAADAAMLFAVMASLAGVGLMLAESSSSKGAEQLLGVGFAIVSVMISWLALHTMFMLHYAEQYYTDPDGGVDFGDTKQPDYHDFAYLAFTIGMTFQVSDTQLSHRDLRRTALHHALLSYVFGTVIVAATVNLVAGLGK